MIEKYEKQLSELQEKYDACPKLETLQRSVGGVVWCVCVFVCVCVCYGMVVCVCVYTIKVQGRH